MSKIRVTIIVAATALLIAPADARLGNQGTFQNFTLSCPASYVITPRDQNPVTNVTVTGTISDTEIRNVEIIFTMLDGQQYNRAHQYNGTMSTIRDGWGLEAKWVGYWINNPRVVITGFVKVSAGQPVYSEIQTRDGVKQWEAIYPCVRAVPDDSAGPSRAVPR